MDNRGWSPVSLKKKKIKKKKKKKNGCSRAYHDFLGKGPFSIKNVISNCPRANLGFSFTETIVLPGVHIAIAALFSDFDQAEYRSMLSCARSYWSVLKRQMINMVGRSWEHCRCPNCHPWHKQEHMKSGLFGFGVIKK